MTHTLKTLLDMPVDELRVLVIKCLGWTQCDFEKFETSELFHLKGRGFDMLKNFPDYCNSLDAMKPLEDGLTDEEREEYVIKLHAVVGLTTGKLKHEWQYDFAIATAIAHHRAVAFVATKMKL